MAEFEFQQTREYNQNRQVAISQLTNSTSYELADGALSNLTARIERLAKGERIVGYDNSDIAETVKTIQINIKNTQRMVDSMPNGRAKEFCQTEVNNLNKRMDFCKKYIIIRRTK